MAEHGGLFDFAKLQEQIAEQNKLAESRRNAQIITQQKTQEIQDRSLELANSYVKDTDFARRDLQVLAQKRELARKLADSNNPFDTIRLIGLQMQDPNGFTRDGRGARIAENAQAVSAIGQLYGIKSQALEAELITAGQGFDRAALLEKIGAERLQQVVDNANTMQAQYESSVKMKELAIIGLTDDEIAAATLQAKKDGKVNVNGVDVDSRTLENRHESLKERRHLLETKDAIRRLDSDLYSDEGVNSVLERRAYERRIQRDENANIEHELARRGYNRELEKDQIGNVQHELEKNQFNREVEKEKLKGLSAAKEEVRHENRIKIDNALRFLQSKELQTMSSQELLRLRQNGYKNGDELYDPADVDAAYTRSMQTFSDSVTSAVREEQLENFDLMKIANEKNRIDEINKRVTPNTPLALATDAYVRALEIASMNAGKNAPLVNRALGYTIYSQAREGYEKALQDQAKLDSKGDKAVEELRLAYYRGNPIPKETLVNTTSERLTHNKSIADLYPPEVAATIEQEYRSRFQTELKKQGVNVSGRTATLSDLIGATSTMSADERKLIMAQIADEAIKVGIAKHAQQRTDQIFGQQTLAPSHPLYGKVSSNQMLGIIGNADQNAFAIWSRENGLSQEEAAAIQEGRALPTDSRIDAASRTPLLQKLRQLENQQLFFELDSIEPGLSRDFVKWWSTDGHNYLEVEQNINRSQAASFQDYVSKSIRSDSEKDAINAYATGLIESHGLMKQEHARRVSEMLDFGGDPNNLQVMLLHKDKNLQSHEKQHLYRTVIQPMLDEARTRGLNFRQTNEYIERNILDFDPKDAETKRLIRTMKRDRSEIIQDLHDHASTVRTLLGFNTDVATPEQAGIDWYLNLQNPNIRSR